MTDDEKEAERIGLEAVAMTSAAEKIGLKQLPPGLTHLQVEAMLTPMAALMAEAIRAKIPPKQLSEILIRITHLLATSAGLDGGEFIGWVVKMAAELAGAEAEVFRFQTGPSQEDDTEPETTKH